MIENEWEKLEARVYGSRPPADLCGNTRKATHWLHFLSRQTWSIFYIQSLVGPVFIPISVITAKYCEECEKFCCFPAVLI